MVSTSALLRAVVCVVPLVPGDLHRLLSFLNWQPTVQALVLPKARSLQPRPNQLDIPLRISPLGASVTWGTGSTDGNGHRGPLCASLVGAGYTVNMVGFTLNGAMKDNENDGYPGLVVHEIHRKSDRVSWELKPNLFLINAGTNNCIRGESPDRIDAAMDDLMDDIFEDKSTVIILSGLLVNAKLDVDECRRRVNEKYSARVASSVSAGLKAVYADMSAITVGDLVDGTHPNDGGYKKMADGWFRAIQEASNRGWIS
ncbi:hypothetical protein DL766_005925 [Monosporascus sp. MC13-8B]|uniref:SGNH hydrolase-type esterase domain-containing protein n=1 Tax=Monosporascus cannonballus TaxID=155416 RepID=A0ABY0HCW7_9PEZI|nr:hypothetical protein DL762_003594 [Monosporascus cannonballus]RYP28334.1 hypothetical protein DL766_005925 [Monosporascus sp. MC13-8B]